MKAIRTAALILFPSLLAFGQEFEVASIKPSPPSASGKANVCLHIDGAMVRYSSLSLTLYLGMAYNLKNYQITAPDWMASDRWDITAKLPDGADPRALARFLVAAGQSMALMARVTGSRAVVEDGVVHFRKVGVVRDLGRQVLVNSGVKRGEQVILNPAVDLAEGTKVRTRSATVQTS